MTNAMLAPGRSSPPAFEGSASPAAGKLRMRPARRPGIEFSDRFAAGTAIVAAGRGTDGVRP